TGTNWNLYRSMKKPMTPSAAATTRSNQLIRKAYTPAQQRATTDGSSTQFGTRSMATQTRMRLMFNTSSKTLPISSEAISPPHKSDTATNDIDVYYQQPVVAEQHLVSHSPYLFRIGTYHLLSVLNPVHLHCHEHYRKSCRKRQPQSRKWDHRGCCRSINGRFW